MDEIIKQKIREKYPEMAKHKDFEDIFDEIFEVLNCHEIDASEISKGMCYIDSHEAAHLTGAIVVKTINLISR